MTQKSPCRPYVIENIQTGETLAIVEAQTQASALTFAVRQHYRARVATGLELYEHGRKGGKIPRAGSAQQELAIEPASQSGLVHEPHPSMAAA